MCVCVCVCFFFFFFCILWFWSFFVFCRFDFVFSWPLLLRFVLFCSFFCSFRVSGCLACALWIGFFFEGLGGGEGGGGGGDNDVHVINLQQHKTRNPDSASPKPQNIFPKILQLCKPKTLHPLKPNSPKLQAQTSHCKPKALFPQLSQTPNPDSASPRPEHVFSKILQQCKAKALFPLKPKSPKLPVSREAY